MGFLKNFSYSFSANLISLIIRVTYVIILPRFIGVVDFGYWQLYFLYTQFLHCCHLGLVDGIYLKIGGILYKDINKKRLIPQLSVLTFLSLFFFGIINLYILCFNLSPEKGYILFIISLDIIFMIPRTFFSIIFQATNMIKAFSISIITESLVSFFMIILFIIFNMYSFEILILGDLLGRICSLVISACFAPEFCKIVLPNKYNFKDAINNIKIGSFLLLANMASVLMLSIFKLIIENKWGIVTFSKISLALSITNMLMVVISSASVVLYPILKRINTNMFFNLYISLKNICSVSLLIALLLFYPFSFILKWWLPNYIESINYISLLAPLMLFESQTILINNNFYKALRKEKIIFFINVFTILLVLLLGIALKCLDINLEIALFGVLLISIAKFILGDYILSKYFSNTISAFTIIMVLCGIGFSILNYLFKIENAGAIYILLIIGIFAVYKDLIRKNYKFIKSII